MPDFERERNLFNSLNVQVSPDESALTALHHSWQEAVRLNRPYIGTQHLLLGLCLTPDSNEILRRMMLEPEKIKNAVEFIFGKVDVLVDPVITVSLTPRLHEVIDLSVDEARRLNDRSFKARHLLLGLLREGKGAGAGILESLGVNLNIARINIQRKNLEEQDQQTSSVTVEAPKPEKLSYEILLEKIKDRLNDPAFDIEKKGKILTLLSIAEDYTNP